METCHTCKPSLASCHRPSELVSATVFHDVCCLFLTKDRLNIGCRFGLETDLTCRLSHGYCIFLDTLDAKNHYFRRGFSYGHKAALNIQLRLQPNAYG